MFDGPLELLGGDEDLAELGVDHCLARVEAGSAANGLLIIEDMLKQCSQNGAASGEVGLAPLGLSGVRGIEGAVDGGGGGRVDEAQELASCWRVALDRRGAGELLTGSEHKSA